MNDHFWLVWNEQGHSPTFKHTSPVTAKMEAERLATQNPGQSFHVLQVTGTARYNAVNWHEYGEFIPF